jgi:hypothetical protein
VAAISGTDVWAVGGEQDSNGLWHTLTEHWDGSSWAVVPAVDAGISGNQLYAVKANASNDVYAVGQQAGAAFPNQSLIEHWDGKAWSVISSPADPSASALPLGVTTSGASLTLVGEQETDTAPYTTYVASGTSRGLSILNTPNNGTGENSLFAAATAANGSTWAVGWVIDPSTDSHFPLTLQGVNGAWSVVSSPGFPTGYDSGLAAITAIPGGGLWAVGVTGTSKSNYSALIEYHQ